jgi:predicted membrane protein (TIGR00267 family)
LPAASCADKKEFVKKEPVTAQDHHYHERRDPHRRSSWLSDVILGGQDGLVNVLGVTLGVAAATQETRTVLIAGLAATFSEAVSMAAVAYSSKRADQAYYESERAREFRHIEKVPELERNEIREIYAAKGFSGDLLNEIVDTITANKKVWVKVMLAEEHQLAPVRTRDTIRSAWIVGLSSACGSMIPVMSFLFLDVKMAVYVAIAISALTLFAAGVFKAKTMVGNPGKSGLEMVAVGILSAMAGYFVGWLFTV